jgi:Pectate lyase superfamily protein
VALELFANQPSTTVSSGGTDAPSSGTVETWTVASSSAFPAASSSAAPPTQFHVADASSSASSELIAVTNVSGTTWTVTRGAESTTPVTHLAGFTVYQVVTAGGMQQASRTDWLNAVTMFGADPTDTTDSTSAIQAAISALPSGGGVVYLPAGTYKLSSALTGAAKMTLLGDGSATTILSQTSTTANGLSGADLSSVTLAGLRFAGPGSGSGKGISLTLSSDTSVPYLDFRDLYVTGFGGNGIAVSTPIVSVFERVISASNGGHGFALSGGGTSVSMVACYANGNTSHGFDLNDLAYCFLGGCAADSNAYGYYLTGCQGVTLAGCGAEATTTDSYVLTAGEGNVLTGCYCYDNVHYGVHVTGGEAGASVIGFRENAPGAATASVITDSGTSSFIANYSVSTAVSFAGTTSSLDTGGNLTAAGTLTVTGTTFGALVKGYGGLDVPIAGQGVAVAEGSNAKQGTASLTSGSKVVTNSSVTSSSRIFLTAQSVSGTAGALAVTARTPGTSFTVTSTSGSDASTFAYEIFEPG